MNLRARVTLIVSLSFLVLAALLVLDGRARQANVEGRLRQSALGRLETSWAGLREAEHQRLLRYVERLQANGEATGALVAGTSARFADATVPTRTRLQSTIRPTNLQAVAADGTPIYDTSAEKPQAPELPVLPPATARRLADRAEAVHGLLRSTQGSVVYAVVAPVIARGGVAGLLVVSTPVSALIQDLANLSGAHAATYGAEGSLRQSAGGLGSAGARAIARHVPIDRAEVTTITLESRNLQLTSMPMHGPLQGRLGTLATVRDVTEQIRQRELVSGLSYFALGCALVLLLAFANWYMRQAFRPLRSVVRSLNALSSGRTDLAVDIPRRDDEIGRLAGTFETFRRGMEARVRLDRLEQELAVAARIQRQVLPASMPQADGIGLSATMRPARDVGGDFYDAFTLPDGRIGCVIADVSDKGMASALMMVAARTVIRSTASLAPEPDACMRIVNTYLAEDNKEMMFVTAFYAVLDPSSGTLDYCNAGHNPPAVLSAGGKGRILPSDTQPALGIWEGFAYTTRTLKLKRGDRFFLYTDGITEAMTAACVEYGAARLLEVLQAGADTSARDLVDRVLDDVETFTAGAEQHDDVTCLSLAYDYDASTAMPVNEHQGPMDDTLPN